MVPLIGESEKVLDVAEGPGVGLPRQGVGLGVKLAPQNYKHLHLLSLLSTASMYPMTLNLRDFPAELNKALKVEAASKGISLRELVIEKCSAKNNAKVWKEPPTTPSREEYERFHVRETPLNAVIPKPVSSVPSTSDVPEKKQPSPVRSFDLKSLLNPRDRCPSDRENLVNRDGRAVCPKCGGDYPLMSQYYYPEA